MSATDYPILGKPTISLASFTHVLQNAGSPAAREAAGIYNAFVHAGVDPAIGLAISQHESGFGKAGIAVGRNNIYGNRYYASQAAFGAVNVKGWAKFPTYTAGAKYEASLLAGGLYGSSGKYNTARTFPFRYAPSADGNSPTNYGNSIVAAITRWSGGVGAIAYHPSSVTALHPKGKAGTKASPKAKVVATPVHPIIASAKAHPKGAAAVTGVGLAAVLLLIL